MRISKRIPLMALGAVALVALGAMIVGAGLGAPTFASTPEVDHDHAGHAEHEDEVHADHEDGDEHADHGDEDGHDGHEAEAAHAGHDHDAHEEEPVRLTAEQQERFGIQVETARGGRLSSERTFPGETRINEDRMAHIVPRAPGIVRAVEATVGDAVEAGDVLAWVESAELGSAKVDYLSKWAELGCCQIDLARAEEVHKNTTHFLEVLRSSPSLSTLRKTNGRAMGTHRSQLVSAYADYVFAREAYEREKSLFDQEIGSREDFLAAERALKRADADYSAAMDEAAFDVERTLLEARSTRQIQEIELLGAERKLHLLGLSQEEIEALPKVVEATGKEGGGEEHECADPNCETCRLERATVAAVTVAPEAHGCTDPNCTDCAGGHDEGHGGDHAVDQHDSHRDTPAPMDVADRLGWYPLTAPFGGMVIERHITLGESVAADDSVFTLADLSTVWVDISVYQRDLDSVRPGREIHLTRGNGDRVTEGTVQFVSPMLDEVTRTALARVVLPNEDGAWRPGLYVEARLSMAEDTRAAVVPTEAVQQLGEDPVVFLSTPEGFLPEPVVTGGADGDRIEILSGLVPGQTYVASGAFALKAHLATSNLSGHAGHGH